MHVSVQNGVSGIRGKQLRMQELHARQKTVPMMTKLHASGTLEAIIESQLRSSDG